MNKISKISGQKELMNRKSKMVLSTTGSLEALIGAFNRIDKEEYLIQTANCPQRIGVRYNNNEVVFQILNGIQEKTQSWLTGLKGSVWYKLNQYDREFIIVVEAANCYISAYELLN